MALLERNRQPTPKELRVFGILLVAFGTLVGGLVLYKSGSWTAGFAIWTVTLFLGLFYARVVSARPLVYHVWMTAFYPIGWLISHALLAGIYYLVITPIGVVMRLAKRDPLERALDRSAPTYWVPAPTNESDERYLQQF